ncbi:MAG: zf-HC2 domain-containing protein [Acidobacteriia bacterium]|nr:zf-HC2 domain-containing protein [Terriglobia bacterium]
MNCSDWEERIAMYVGGELAASEAAEVGRHVADCAGCQVFASGLQQSLALLRAAHQEPLAPAHFAAVRARVLAELAGERRAWWRRAWVYGLAGAAAVALLVALAGRPGRAPQPVRRPEIAVTRPPAEPPKVAVAEAAPEPKPVPRVRHGRRAGPGPAPQPVQLALARPPETMTVKLVTDDPNIVIYWITETRGEQK